MAKRKVKPSDLELGELGVLTTATVFGWRGGALDLEARFSFHVRDGCTVLRFLVGPLGLTRQDICKEIGLTTSALGHFLKGRAPLPMKRRLQLLDVLKNMLDVLRECTPKMEQKYAGWSDNTLRELEASMGPVAVATLVASKEYQQQVASAYMPLVKQMIKTGEQIAKIEAKELGLD